MPAPLARGIIFSLSLLIAAGLAVYENPEFRAWVEDSRRKIALALNDFSDEILPRPPYSRSPSDDASTREDDSPQAVERRRAAREDILERARVIEERRRSNANEAKRRRGASFDDLVDTEGKLRGKDGAAISTATETVADEKEGLRNRSTEAAGAALGAAMANPFADEAGMDIWDEKAEAARVTAVVQSPVMVEEPSWESTATLLCTTAAEEPSRESTATLPAPSPQPLTIDTDAASTHPSELLVDLTPTTSVAPSSFRPGTGVVLTPTSETEDRQIGTMSDYQSVHDWAEEASNASFYSPPQSERATGPRAPSMSASTPTSAAPSVISSAEHLSEAGDVLSEADMMSDVEQGSIATPDSWTEVGSVVSEEGQ